MESLLWCGRNVSEAPLGRKGGSSGFDFLGFRRRDSPGGEKKKKKRINDSMGNRKGGFPSLYNLNRGGGKVFFDVV